MGQILNVVKPTANLNVRVPAVSHETLREIALELGTSINTVVNAVLEYALAPNWLQLAWAGNVDGIREVLVNAGFDHSTQMYDFTEAQWVAKRQFYDRLEEVGLIEHLKTKKSANFSDRVLCSFRLTMTGRVIARVLSNGGGFNKVTEHFQPPAVRPEVRG